MKNHQLICQQCGQEFESSRSDAKYCSQSCKTRASQIRSEKKPVVKINFEQHEYEELLVTANDFNLSIEELVKYRSMLTSDDLKHADEMYKKQQYEIKMLKAELSLHTKSPSSGIYLDLSDKQKLNLFNVINQSKEISKIVCSFPEKIYATVLYCCKLETEMYSLLSAVETAKKIKSERSKK